MLHLTIYICIVDYKYINSYEYSEKNFIRRKDKTCT